MLEESIDLKKIINNRVLDHLESFTKSLLIDYCKKYKIKCYSSYSKNQLVKLIKNYLNDNSGEIYDLYLENKIQLDYFKKDIMRVLLLSDKNIEKLKLEVSGYQDMYIKKHHQFKKYDISSVENFKHNGGEIELIYNLKNNIENIENRLGVLLKEFSDPKKIISSSYCNNNIHICVNVVAGVNNQDIKNIENEIKELLKFDYEIEINLK